MTSYDSQFEEHVRDLLSHLYDYLKLVNNPLAGQLARGASGGEKAEAARTSVLRAIDQLRRDENRSLPARANRLHRLLRLRYVDELETQAVISQLALSERQYYREHQRAIKTVSQIVWDAHFAREHRAPQFLADELAYLTRDKGRRLDNPRVEIEAAIRATRVLAEERSLSIRLAPATAPLSLPASQPIFRHFIIYLLNALIDGAEPGGAIDIALLEGASLPSVAFSGGSLRDGEAICEATKSDATGRALLENLRAELRWEGAPPRLCLAFQGEARSVLIVDDNPDSVRLFKRYLAGSAYRVLSTDRESEALRLAQGAAPLCIILDIMLPGKDGWQILQNCKNNPATAAIPVLVCSVLEMEGLALSLGADAYLSKPPPRDQLLALLRQWAGADLPA